MRSVKLSLDGLLLTDAETAEIMSLEFVASFTGTRDLNFSHLTIGLARSSGPQLSQFSCDEKLVWNAIHQYSISNSSLDGI